MKDKLTTKTKCIIYAVILILSVIWLVVGTCLITPDASGAVCFFALTLPVLLGLAMIGLLLRLMWTSRRAKKREQNELSNKQ